MKRDEIDMNSNDAGRDGLSARLFLRPFPAAASLRKDRVVKLLHSLAAKGSLRLFLVGGLLRNLALSVDKGPDYDIVIDGGCESFARSAARALRGTAFLLDKETPSYRVVVKGAGKKPRAVIDISPVKGGGITDDLNERDFTVNALGMDIASVFSSAPQVCDPTGALADASAKRISAVTPRVFDDDPLRVLRAVRLAQHYGLEITDETRELMGEKSVLLRTVSVERVRDELIGILSYPGTAASIETCYESGIIGAVLPQLASWEDVEGYPLKAHALKTVAEAELIIAGIQSGDYLSSFPKLKTYLRGSMGPVGRVALFKLAALLHDAGKPMTISRASGQLRFIGHDASGAPLVRELLTGLKLSRKASAFVSLMARNHHRVFMLASLEEPSSRAMSHFFRAVGAQEGIMLILLALADARATRGSEDFYLLDVAASVLSFYYSTYTRRRPRPLLTGKEIMDLFGVPEGWEVGLIIAKISEGVETGAVSTRDEAVELVKRHLGAGGG